MGVDNFHNRSIFRHQSIPYNRNFNQGHNSTQNYDYYGTAQPHRNNNKAQFRNKKTKSLPITDCTPAYVSYQQHDPLTYTTNLSNRYKKQFDKMNENINDRVQYNTARSTMGQNSRIKPLVCVEMSSKQRVPIYFQRNKMPHNALIDTGATTCHLAGHVVESNPYLRTLKRIPIPPNQNKVVLADGTNIAHLYKIQARFYIAGKSVTQSFLVSAYLPAKIILGQDFLRQTNAVISFHSNMVYFDFDPYFRAHTDYRLKPKHSGLITVTLPQHIKKNQCVALYPSIPHVNVTDSLIQPQKTGRFQTARIFVQNDTDTIQRIHKNQIIGISDYVDHNKIARSPTIDSIAHLQQTVSHKKEPGVTHQGRVSLNAEQYVHDSNIRPLSFFKDKSIDITQFDTITRDYHFLKFTNNPRIDDDTSNKLKYVILKNLKAFHKPGTPLTKVKNFEYKMKPKQSNAPPWPCKFQPIHPTQKEHIDREIKQQVSNGTLKPIQDAPAQVFDSPFSTPCLIIKRPGLNDNTPKLIADVRELNRYLEAYPKDHTLETDKLSTPFANMHLNTISSLDVSQGYAQLGLSTDSLPFSVVTIGMARFFTDRTLMGTHSTIACWAHFMSTVLNTLEHKYVYQHIEDLFITAKNPHEHLLVLNELLQRSIEYNLTYTAANSHFFRANIHYQGQCISTDKVITPHDSNTRALVQMKIPEDIPALQRFVNMAIFFKHYIPGFNDIIHPLKKRLKNAPASGSIMLTPEEISAVNTLKESLTGEKVLHIPDHTLDFELVTDASKTGLGAVLFQRSVTNDKPQLRVIAYASKILTPAQQKYDIWILECLAIVTALTTFHPLIKNSKINVYTDNISLKFLLQSPKSFARPTQSRLQRWLFAFGRYNTRIHYVKGTNNIADGLSRDNTTNGDSLISEKELNDLFNRKLTHTTDLTIYLRAMREQGYQFKNTLSPTKIQQLWLQPNRHQYVELIYNSHADMQHEYNTVLDYPNETHIPSPHNTAFNSVKDNTENILPSQTLHKTRPPCDTSCNTLSNVPTQQTNKPKPTDMAGDGTTRKPPPPLYMTKEERQQLKKERRLIRRTQQRQLRQIDDIHDGLDLLKDHNVKDIQENDNLCGALITYLRHGHLPEEPQKARVTLALAQDCRLHNGILYKLKLNEAQQQIPSRGYQLVVPEALRELVLDQVHKDTAHAALSTFITFLRGKYFWPNMIKSATTFIQQCTACSKLGSGFIKYKTSYIYTNHAFYHLIVDIAGPFHTSRAGFRYVLTTIDTFSAYIVNTPLVTTTAQEVCEHLLQIYTTYGFPLKITTDNAQYFNANFFKTLHEKLGTHKMTISAHRPWTVGKIEKTHATLANRMTKMIQADPDTWERQVKYVTFSMNATKSARTGLSPHEIIFGKPIACPSSTILDDSPGNMALNDYMKYTFECLQANLRDARQASQKYIHVLLARSKKDAKSNHQYQPYDQVWVYKPNNDLKLARKLATKYVGPFMICEQTSANTYKISKGLGCNPLKGTVPAQRLKPFYIKSVPPLAPTPAEEQDILTTNIPNTEQEEPPTLDLKDSCTSDPHVRSRDTDVDLYKLAEDAESDPDSDDEPLDNGTSDAEETDIFPPTVKIPMDESRIIEFDTAENQNKTTRRNQPLEQYNTSGELTHRCIRRIFGIVQNSKPNLFVLQLHTGELTRVTRDHLTSQVLERLHGKHLNKLTEAQIDDIQNTIEKQTRAPNSNARD